MVNTPNNPKYSWVYQELTKNDNDEYNLVNSIAYIIYKQRKIEFYALHNGNPTEEQVRIFHDIYMMPGQLEALREQAGLIVTDILNTAFAKKITDLEAKLDQEIVAEMKRELVALKTAINLSQTKLDTNLDINQTAVMTELGEINEKGVTAWFKEIGKAVVITIVSTVVLWLLFLAFVKGQETQDRFTNKLLPKDTSVSTPK
ncbi:hypothetical protein [Acinetobacter calcoaceticus]